MERVKVSALSNEFHLFANTYRFENIFQTTRRHDKRALIAISDRHRADTVRERSLCTPQSVSRTLLSARRNIYTACRLKCTTQETARCVLFSGNIYPSPSNLRLRQLLVVDSRARYGIGKRVACRFAPRAEDTSRNRLLPAITKFTVNLSVTLFSFRS